MLDRGALPALGVVIFALLSASSCDLASWVTQTKPATAQHGAEPPPDEIAAAKPQQPLPPKLLSPIPAGVIDVLDVELRSTGATPLTGDRRPIWIVSGRIRNHWARTIVAVTLHVSVYDLAAPDIVDSADLRLSTRILPRQARSFAENIQITPPKGKWSWSVDVMEADGE